MKKKAAEAGKLYLIPAVVLIVFALLLLFPAYRIGEKRVYDILLKIKPAVEEKKEIVLLNIDDLAIAQAGVWPWSRDIVADGLVLLREFDTSHVVFDIEYVDRSPRGIDSRYLEENIPELFNDQFTTLKENIVALFSAIASGAIPLQEAEDYVYELAGLTESARETLLEAARYISRDNDDYLGKAARFFGNAFFTVNMLPDEIELINVSEELKSYVEKNLYRDVSGFEPDIDSVFYLAKAVQPAILPIITRGKGAGFPNVVVDDDGVRRRIDLFINYRGKLYAQLVTAPLLDYLGNPEISVSGKNVTFKNAQFPDGTEKNITIPLTSDGKMLINWPAKLFVDSFRHISFNNLLLHDKYLENLIKNLEIMEKAGYLAFYQGETPLLSMYHYAEDLKHDIFEGILSPEDTGEFRTVRDFFLSETGKFLDGQAEKAITDRIDQIMEHPDFEESNREAYTEIRDEVGRVFGAVKADYKNLMEIRQLLARELPGAFAVMGHTGISTTDIGVNPFEKNYMNVGTHAAVANTILTGRFITELPLLYSILLAAVLAILGTFIVRKTDPKKVVLAGILFIAVTAAAAVALFSVSRIYLPVLTPLLTTFFTFLSVAIFKFVKSESEKSFLRNAFSRYLSSDVISQLIQNPDLLNLGGEKKELTAIFTDVKGFSTISESLDPQDLVKLLNFYLSAMSDIILEEKGTIDKYEGDAIISFYGAPIDLKDHAYRACLSAIRMKRKERELNEQFLKDAIAPSPLLTRVGINTGEMVVGNMGTPRKMDYTIMGNSVNLAARLEGVNKQYGTWVLASEATIDKAGDEFLTRMLDRVRVVGINTPVRLHELVEEKSGASREQTEGIEIFHDGLVAFENKEWEKAEKIFQDVLRVLPEDGPSAVYIDRCKKYRESPPASSWDGVFNLSVK